MTGDLREVSVKDGRVHNLVGFHPETGESVRFCLKPDEGRYVLPGWFVDTLSGESFTFHRTNELVEDADDSVEEDEAEDQGESENGVETGVVDSGEPVVETGSS